MDAFEICRHILNKIGKHTNTHTHNSNKLDLWCLVDGRLFASAQHHSAVKTMYLWKYKLSWNEGKQPHFGLCRRGSLEFIPWISEKDQCTRTLVCSHMIRVSVALRFLHRFRFKIWHISVFLPWCERGLGPRPGPTAQNSGGLGADQTEPWFVSFAVWEHFFGPTKSTGSFIFFYPPTWQHANFTCNACLQNHQCQVQMDAAHVRYNVRTYVRHTKLVRALPKLQRETNVNNVTKTGTLVCFFLPLLLSENRSYSNSDNKQNEKMESWSCVN